MVLQLEDIGNICRFCLCREDLRPLSEAARSAFTIEDATHHTGVELSENEGVPYAICDVCCHAITATVNFRRACSRNDFIFKKLVLVLNRLVKDNTFTRRVDAVGAAIITNGESQRYGEESSLEEKAKDAKQVITLDDSDSDTCTPDANVLRIGENAGTGKIELNLISSDAGDSNDSIPSLYSEMLQKACDVNDVTRFGIPIRKRSTESIERMELTIPAYEKEEEETKGVPNRIESNKISPDDDDSNDSLPSLYEEAMAASKGQKKVPKEKITDSENATRGVSSTNARLCALCGVMTKCMKNHMQMRHDRNTLGICPHCSKQFVSKADLKWHVNTWHEKRIILTCVVCGKGFTNHNSHFYHMKNSHGERDVYECKVCHRKLKSYDGYKKHLKEHSLIVHPCPHCNKKFKTLKTLEKHQLRYHSS